MLTSSRPQRESPDVLTATGVAVLAFHAWVNVALAVGGAAAPPSWGRLLLR